MSLDEPDIRLLDGVTFALLCMDAGDPATWGRVSRNAPFPCGSGRRYSTAMAGSDACPLPCWGTVRLAAQFRLRPEEGLRSGLTDLH